MSNPAWVMALAAAQHLLHAVLNADRRTEAAFAPLNGRSIEARLSSSPLAVRLCFEGGLAYLEPAGADADVTVEGELGALIQLARDTAAGKSAMVMDGVRVEGSVGVLKALSDAFAQIDIDVEHELSVKFGDPAAAAMTSTLKAIAAPLLGFVSNGRAQVRDYVKHEQTRVLTRAELDAFSDQTRALRNRLDRLERAIRSKETR
ncbi:ubiquinone biosynthesis accessory factor UbiJ [Litorivicinus lipolyticus]|uniref:ubiquinone biosynthesis accessory factor UbiJ n=1 Tax=Litorivicinus lipolyticus TaxID=418701 RepID=UPI003B5AD565